jgi:hypothetical protein
MFLFGEPMKMIAVADDGGSFFAGYSLFLNKEKLPQISLTDSPKSNETTNTDISTRFFFARFIVPGSPTVGQPIRIRAYVNPVGQSINLIKAEITYSTSTLRLTEIDSYVSDFSLNLISDIQTGSASIIAMQPWPGIATSSVVVDLVLMPLAAGPAEINFTPKSAAFANDGFGTEVFTVSEPVSFTIEQ